MKKEISLYIYNREKGVFNDEINESEFISFHIDKKQVIIKANQEGFIKLGKLFLSFAYNDIPDGRHIYLDDEELSGILTDKSSSVVVYKKN